ncbi:hypothetical protein LJR231_003141 [Phyllobacterium sp. LjRoot231]|uniref:hypothetical protein n=1 Tax=Phyllobacterium sp. LjRoot231 TaxID=3342289 RepID=UPI003ED0FECD
MHELSRVSTRSGSYGLGFTKSFIGKLGGGPLSYLNGERYEAIALLLKASANDRNEPVLKLCPFIDHVLNTNQFDGEREWRVPAPIPVSLDNVCFLVLPILSFGTYFVFTKQRKMPLA